MSLRLERFGSTPMGTFGRLTLGDASWFTVERPWMQNKPSVSCIPAGAYRMKLGFFYSGDGIGGKPDYPAYELLHVPGRALIKIHKGNRMLDVRGCIALGKDLGAEGGMWCVRRSADAYAEFMAAAAQADVDTIAIRWADPEAD